RTRDPATPPPCPYTTLFRSPTGIEAPAMDPAMDVPAEDLPGTTASWTTAPATTPIDIVGGPELTLTMSTERPLDGSVADSAVVLDRKSTRLNSSHVSISYAV